MAQTDVWDGQEWYPESRWVEERYAGAPQHCPAHFPSTNTTRGYWVCTLLPGHTGRHVAHLYVGGHDAYAVWYDLPAALRVEEGL